MAAENWSTPALDAIRRAFTFAREAGHSCGPADFLVGIAEGPGAAAAALNPSGAVPLRQVAAAARRDPADSGGYLHMQVQAAQRCRSRPPGASRRAPSICWLR